MNNFLYDRRLVLKENSTDESILYFSGIEELDNDFFEAKGNNFSITAIARKTKGFLTTNLSRNKKPEKNVKEGILFEGAYVLLNGDCNYSDGEIWFAIDDTELTDIFELGGLKKLVIGDSKTPGDIDEKIKGFIECGWWRVFENLIG
ncbi:hypothetical protein GOV12_03645 [Candidatus Pacearchaeota archaeon]|nr:hypothetical protein [Candidatus Pacearchaeota archaeon]